MKEQQPVFTPSFSLLKPSARALYLNIGTFLGLFAISMGLSILGNLAEDGSAIRSMFGFISFVAGIIVAPALVIAQLKSAKGEQIELVETIKAGLPLIVRLFLLQLAIFFIVVIGLILFIIPGIFAAQRLMLAQYFLIDKDMTVWDAIKQSFEQTKANPGPVWGIIGVNIVYLLLIFTIILIPVSIALLVAYSIAPAFRYFEFQKAAKAVKTKKASGTHTA